MKKLIIVLSLTLGISFSTTALIACGGGDDENESGKTVDGVNVATGKKLLELKLDYEYEDHYRLPTNDKESKFYKMTYDSKGRLNKIDQIEFETGRIINSVLIDYDLRVIKYNRTPMSINDPLIYNYDFALNKDGYVGQIGTFSLSYNSKGYLVDVKGPEMISTVTYAEEYIKSSLSNLKNGNITMTYITYDNISNQGDLYFSIQSGGYFATSPFNYRDGKIYFFIAYQAGMFGKVVENVFNLTNKSKAEALVDYIGERMSYNIKMTFFSE